MRVFVILVVLGMMNGFASAQGLIVGSGNFFSPIVSNLDAAVEFYRDGLGLDVQGAPGSTDDNPAIGNMFGLPDARIQWSIARTPAGGGGVEIVEISGANGQPLERRMQDPGAFTLIVFVRDLDATLSRVEALGAPVVSSGGEPVSVPFGEGATSIVVVKDPDGHFVEIVQSDEMPTSQGIVDNVVSVRVRLTVENVEESIRLYTDVLGLELLNEPEWVDNSTVAQAFGIDGAEYRAGIMQVPASGLIFEVIDFRGIDRRQVRGGIQDPGSTRIQFLIHDVDAAVAAVEAVGGYVVSTGGQTMQLPVPGSSIKVAIAREPDNLFLVMIESAAPE
jgi:catechol 2,3-dioxygenase-like lactoylglutathione lyase family enzyme